MRILKPILILLLTCCGASADGQKQLVLLKGERVLLRLYPGDDLIYRQKGNRSIKTTYVNNISDTAVVTHRDTVPFHTIERLYFKQHKFYNTVGAALVIFGAGLFLIDQINLVLVQGQSPSLDNRVSTVSLTALAVGVPLMVLKKRSQRLDFRNKLIMVEAGSVFYRPDTREYILPYENN
ncbi:MAG: hypothetical protein WEB30_06465 [Cyclobacteriaceae bacterium]